VILIVGSGLPVTDQAPSLQELDGMLQLHAEFAKQSGQVITRG
jgi:hypothetical protein